MTRRECYEIQAIEGETPGILDDKLGGKPYLPIGIEWPKDSNNMDMSLLLQINLRNIKLDGFPTSGILEIFAPFEIDYCDAVVTRL